MELVNSIINFWRHERGYWRTRKSLHDLDDRILRDIGVRRDEIDSLALVLRDRAREEVAAQARNRRDERMRRRGFGGRGLAAQH